MEPLGARPSRSDYTPSGDGDYAEAMDRWERHFSSWCEATREKEWHWGATLRSIAGSYGEWKRLETEPLPEVAKWARAQGRTVE